MKYWVDFFIRQKTCVALFTRAWIEIASLIKSLSGDTVALFTRAWIEIKLTDVQKELGMSRPLHEGVD